MIKRLKRILGGHLVLLDVPAVPLASNPVWMITEDNHREKWETVQFYNPGQVRTPDHRSLNVKQRNACFMASSLEELEPLVRCKLYLIQKCPSAVLCTICLYMCGLVSRHGIWKKIN